MKLTNLKVSLFSAAALALSASQGFAQSSGRVSVKVPFDFTAGTTVLPAGTYNFSEESTGVMHISSAERHKAIVVLTNPEPGGQGRENPSLKFDKINGQYALTEVNMYGEPVHRILRFDEKSASLNSKLALTNATAKSLR